MKIRYIIDTPYEGKITLTDTDIGYTRTITEAQARWYIEKNKDGCFLSAKADVALRSVDQKEIFPDTMKALSELTVRA